MPDVGLRLLGFAHHPMLIAKALSLGIGFALICSRGTLYLSYTRANLKFSRDSSFRLRKEKFKFDIFYQIFSQL